MSKKKQDDQRIASPLRNVVTGFVMGIFLYFINGNNARAAAMGTLFFALGVSFVDYCILYYDKNRKRSN